MGKIKQKTFDVFSDNLYSYLKVVPKLLMSTNMARKHIDQDTGEVLQEPEFIKIYINDLCKVKGITGLQMNVFHFMLRHMNDHNEVSYGKSAKERFCQMHSTSPAAFNNSINGLLISGLVERINRGEFRINKKYAVRVDWDRVQSIIWTSIYTKDGKKETITFEESKD